MKGGSQELRQASAERVAEFLDENLASLLEDEAIAILENLYVTPSILGRIAQTARVTAFYSVRLRLVAHRQTPQAHAVRLIHYLYWFDLIRLSIDVRIPAPVRRAIDNQLLARAEKLSAGEKVNAARRCSTALIRFLLFDPSARVFEALLANRRIREDDILLFASSPSARPEHLAILGADPKWSTRYVVRKTLVLNPLTPRATAASQLRFLTRRDLASIHRNPSTSLYLKRCIERLRPDAET